MRMFVFAILFVLLLGIAFADGGNDSGSGSSSGSNSGNGDAGSVSSGSRVSNDHSGSNTIGARTERIRNAEDARERIENRRKESLENIREKTKERVATVREFAERKNLTRVEAVGKLRERVKSRCEASNDDGVKRLCTAEIEKVQECKDVNDNEIELNCKRNLVASAALHMVRERQNLNEQCKRLIAGNRSTCERRINTIFKNENHAKFLEFVRNKVNRTEDLNDSERAEIKEKHETKVKELKVILLSKNYMLIC